MNFNGFSNKRIPDLTSAITLTGSEYVSIFQDGTLKKVTVSQISAGTGAIEGSVPSGGIEGNFLRKSSGTNFDSAWAGITEDDLPATVRQGLERMLVIGELSTFVEFATGVVCDYVFVWAPFTIKAIDIICPITPATGEITIDLVYRATPGGELSSLYTNNSKPTIQCNGYASWATFTGSSLPDTVQLAQNSILGFRIVSAPKDAQDLYITVR